MTLVGKTISHFRVLSLIGSGGMGEVYEAEDTKLRRLVALKVLSPSRAGSSGRRERLLREARAAAAVSHANIAIIHEVDEVDGVTFIAMERLHGKTLREVLAGGPLPVDEAIRVAHEIAQGLAHAHRMNIVHRDLKPENVILAGDGRVKILDFGIARVIPQFDSDETSDSDAILSTAGALTREGAFLGTLSYASPEQVRGQEVDAKSDLFSLGTVLYELITGTNPFRRATPIETASAILRDDPVPPTRMQRDAPESIDRIVARCLEKDSSRRYPSAEELLRDLDAVQRGDPVGAVRGAWTRRRTVGALAAAAFVLIAAMAGVRQWTSRGGTGAETNVAERSPSDSISSRRSVAVLGFKDLSGSPGASWLSTALSEMLTTELAVGEAMRTISGESVSQMKLDLGLAEEPSFGAETLYRIRKHLGADLVVLGSYVVLGDDDRQIRLDLRLQDARDGETLASVVQTGTEKNLFDLVAIAGGKLRSSLGVTPAAAGEDGALASALPADAEATRLYAEGLEKLRRFEALPAQELLARSTQLDPGRAVTHAALASAWEHLGYEERQLESAARAFELSRQLPRESQLAIESMYRQANREWDRAIAIQRTLWDLFPDNVDYAVRLAAMQTRAGKGRDALAMLEELRRRLPETEKDPRVDLAEANAASAVTDMRRAVAASRRAVSAAATSGAKLFAAQAQLTLGSALGSLGEADSAMATLEEARDAFAAAGDRNGAARALASLANLIAERGDPDTAIQQFERALEVYRETGSKSRESGTLNDMANVYYHQGDLARAKALYEESLAVDIEAGNHAGIPHRLGNIANVLDNQGDLKGAMAMHQRALVAFEEIDHKAGAARTRNNIGLLYLQQGQVGDARKAFEEAIAVQREAGFRHNLASTLIGLGSTLLAQDDLPGARRAIEESLRIREELGETDASAYARIELGRIALAEGKLEEAKNAGMAAAQYFLEQKSDPARIEALSLQAEAHLALGESNEARKAVDAAEVLAARAENQSTKLAAEVSAARVRGNTGEIEAASKKLLDAARQASELGIVFIALDARLAEGEISLRGRDPASARARLATLQEEARRQGYLIIARMCAEALRGT